MNYKPTIGTSINDLNTPCLIIDLTNLEHNMNHIKEFYSDKTSKLRPHSKNHKTPAIAHLQINTGGTVGGVCASKVSEAEVMVDSGIKSILITSEIVDVNKIRRMNLLAKRSEINVAIDDFNNAEEISKQASQENVNIGLIIEIETGMNRCGVQTPEMALNLAKSIINLPNITFKGLMSHQTINGVPHLEERSLEAHKTIAKVIESKELIEQNNINVDIISTGETWSYDVAASIPGVTEIQGGSYLMMETDYHYMSEFAYSAKILATVTETPDSNTAILNVGMKHISTLKGVPIIQFPKSCEVVSMNTISTTISTNGIDVGIGDQVILLPSQQDAMVSRWNEFIGVRDGLVETIWDITARGCIS
jgi:D-serine deaminase-like pyridoxal phosphate-dependent protein